MTSVANTATMTTLSRDTATLAVQEHGCQCFGLIP